MLELQLNSTIKVMEMGSKKTNMLKEKEVMWITTDMAHLEQTHKLILVWFRSRLPDAVVGQIRWSSMVVGNSFINNSRWGREESGIKVSYKANYLSLFTRSDVFFPFITIFFYFNSLFKFELKLMNCFSNVLCFL